MVSYFVSYRGRAESRSAFLAYYRNEHAQVLAQFPGIKSLALYTPVPWVDPFPVNPGGRILLAQMTFESPDALTLALASDARARAREDFLRFPPFEGAVTHQAIQEERVF